MPPPGMLQPQATWSENDVKASSWKHLEELEKKWTWFQLRFHSFLHLEHDCQVNYTVPVPLWRAQERPKIQEFPNVDCIIELTVKLVMFQCCWFGIPAATPPARV